MVLSRLLLRAEDPSNCSCIHHGEPQKLKIAFGILVPVLVILSGIFAGLTLGYMSLDETQLNVLSTSGSETQKKYAAKILPIRKNGHLLLITLILSNMIVNESLPVVADPLFGGGIPAIAVSTALIVIFAEIIPQTLCTRYGLYIGAKMAPFMRVLILFWFIVAWPVSKLLEWILGPHHGIIYRRAELKELIAMHAEDHKHGAGGELHHDTAAIIGHTLDLQEKVVKDAMTPIDKVFMLSIDSVLDYVTLAKIHKTGHSRIPVYTEVDSPWQVNGKTEKVKKILGILLVKQCVLLDPEDATPLRSIPLNKVPNIPFDEPLLDVLDRFQEGRSHMAIVSVMSSKRAASVKEVVKPALTKRFRNRFRDSDSSDEDLESATTTKVSAPEAPELKPPELKPNMTLPHYYLEQTMPADALLRKSDADKFIQGFDPLCHPMGVITLEDVVEELIGEEIYDEYDLRGVHALAASTYLPPEAAAAVRNYVPPGSEIKPPMIAIPPSTPVGTPGPSPLIPQLNSAGTDAGTAKPKTGGYKVPFLGAIAMPNVLRTRSAPGSPRGGAGDAALPPLEQDVLPAVVVEKPHEDTEKVSAPNAASTANGDQRTNALGLFTEEPKDALGATAGEAKATELLQAASTPLPPSTPISRGPSTPVAAGSTATSAQVAPTIVAGRSPAKTGLAEAVLRGRQARLAAPHSRSNSISEDVPTLSATALAPGGAATAKAKGRFKSSPIDGNLVVPIRGIAGPSSATPTSPAGTSGAATSAPGSATNASETTASPSAQPAPEAKGKEEEKAPENNQSPGAS